jgi:hypothetical protein
MTDWGDRPSWETAESDVGLDPTTKDLAIGDPGRGSPGDKRLSSGVIRVIRAAQKWDIMVGRYGAGLGLRSPAPAAADPSLSPVRILVSLDLVDERSPDPSRTRYLQ